MRIYFREMFPLPARIAQAVLFSCSFLALLSLTVGRPSSLFGVPSVIAAVDVFLVTLMLRLMDELKDIDIDRALFPHRPVPSGRVLPRDIVITLTIVLKIYASINLAVPALALPALALLAYCLFMFAHFFTRRIHRSSLLLSLLTHNPVVALLVTLLVWGFVSSNGSAFDAPLAHVAVLGGVMYWSVMASWEISRKIRSPEEETAYVTYSRIFGYRAAVAITFALQTTAFCIGSFLAVEHSFSVVYYPVLSLGFGFTLMAQVRFLVSPSRRTNRLRSATEFYAMLVFVAHLAEYGVRLAQEAGHV
jgi:4-hydroxybenzoate polyprenyltransferase